MMMMMMMMMMMVMNCYYEMVDRRNLISSLDHSQRLLPWQASELPQAGFESGQNQTSGFVQCVD